MLSIIISTYKPNLLRVFINNISLTIGDIEYEILPIQNPGIMSICEAYNKGAEQAQYENLLFIHEDVEFATQNWGAELVETLKQQNIGCVGVAGSTYTPNVPFSWWSYPANDFRNIIQCNRKGEIKFIKSISSDKIVTSIDGVFISCRKEIYEKYRFNTAISGFHCYDIDFSNRVSHQFENLVTSKILIKHYSEGSTNKDWMDALIKYRKTFDAHNRSGINKKVEAYFFNCFIDYLDQFSYTKKDKRRLILKYANPKYIGWKLALKSILNTI